MMRAITVCVAAAALMACAAHSTQPDVATTGIGDVRVTTLGSKLPATDRQLLVFVQVRDSEALTVVFRKAMAERGASLTDNREAAQVVYDIEGKYVAHRPATGRKASASFGDVIAKSGEGLKSGSGSFTVMAGGDAGSMLFGSLVMSSGILSGPRDWFNTQIAGDPDGFCAANCQRWVYEQQAVARLQRTTREDRIATSVEVRAEAEGRELAPVPLVNSAVHKMLAILVE